MACAPARKSGAEQKFCRGDQHGNLADPKKEHPLDDFGFDIGPILLGHEPFGEIIFLLAEGQFEALGNSTGFRWLDLSRFENRKDFCRAHWRND